MAANKKIYLAGRMRPFQDYRDSILNVPFRLNSATYDLLSLGVWPIGVNAIFGKADYVGPYAYGYPDIAPGGESEPGRHGITIMDSDTTAAAVRQACMTAITSCDILFGYIDDMLAYGTLFEIGYATALNKTVVLAFPNPALAQNLWFVAGISSPNTLFLTKKFPTPGELLDDYLKAYTGAARNLDPLYKKFLSQWTTAFPADPLTVRSTVATYTLPLAHTTKKYSIQINDLDNISNQGALADAAAQERALMVAGWQTVVFGAKEIRQDIAGCVTAAAALINR
jgi:hypothetical protein